MARIRKLYGMAGGVERAAEIVEHYKLVRNLNLAMTLHVQERDQYAECYDDVLMGVAISIVTLSILATSIVSMNYRYRYNYDIILYQN